MPRVFGVPNTLAPEFHPHSLQPGARVVEGFEIPENRIQTEPCNEGVRIVSLDGGFRPHLAIDGDRKWNILQGPICIPSYIGGKPVVQIGAIAFSELPEITEVIIPAGITLISQRAFFECSKLRSAKIYVNGVDSVQVIGDSFPPGCIVTYARSPNSVTQGVQTSVNKIM